MLCRLIKSFVFCGLLLPLWCVAVYPYTPVIHDPVLEPWRWRVEEALSNLGVLCMDEAEDGTLWFGNIGSIASYDGVNVTKIPFDEEFLSKITYHRDPPMGKALLVLPDGNLLILVGESLVLRKGDEWDVILQNVGNSDFEAFLKRSDDGIIWLFVPDALWRISGDLTDASIVKQSSSENTMDSFCQDLKGDLWVVERTGMSSSRLVHIPVENSRPKEPSAWREFPIPFENDKDSSQIIAGRDGLIWYGNGDKSTRLEAFDSNLGCWISRKNAAPPTSCYSLMRSRDGSIWAGSSGKLLCSRYKGDEVFYSRSQLELSRAQLTLYEDRNDRLWLIGRIGYVYSVDLGDSEWTTYTGLHFECETSDGVQWFIYKKKRVVSHDPRSGEWRRYDARDGLIDKPKALILSSHGLLWAACQHEESAAFSVFDGTRWKRFVHPEFAQWIEPNAVMEAADGTMWFGAGGRQLQNVPNAGGALQYKVNEDRSVELIEHHSPPYFPYYVTALAQMPDGTLWLGSTVPHRYDGSSPRAHPVLGLQGENVVDMTLDHEQTLWVAKEHFGVCQWQGDSWKVFGEKEGVASLLLSSLLVLPDGSLLAGSDEGISRFDGKTWVRLAYPKWFAMSKRWCGMRMSDDDSIWFNYVNDDVRKSYILDPDDEYCTIRHQPEKKAPDTRIIDYLKRVSQPGNCHISWTGHDPWSNTSVEELQYSWRLNGGEWSAFSLETGRTFLDLDSGRHTLEVRARDRAFNVDPTPARIEFGVIPPIWQQAWFVTMVSLFIGTIMFLTWLLIHNRERRLVERQKECEEHLQEMDRLKTGFFTNISHELRAPMTVICGRLQTIISSAADEEIKDGLSIVMRNAQRVSTLITQLLDFRKIAEGKIKIEATQGDLIPPLRDWVASQQVLAENSKISLSLECAEECRGWFDFDKLQKICTNLISNSIKYTKAGGDVRVSLQIEERNQETRVLKFTVEDTGVGISEEHLGRIFERFYRVSEASMAVGAGIGLNLTKELIDLLGGEIRAESPIHPDAEHPGTRFTVFLPMDGEMGEDGTRRRASERSGEIISQGEIASEGSGSHAKETVTEPEELRAFAPSREAHPSLMGEDTPLILIVEDDQDIRSFIIDQLKAFYRVETAGNGAVGLQKAKELVPDLIITDLMMPVMSGVDMCRELKTSLVTSHIPVVMLTAKTAHESQIEGLKTGADDYITKPFHMDILQVRIANLLESRRLLREQFLREYPVLTPIIPEKTQDKEFLEKAIHLIEENYSDWEFRPDRFADGLNMSQSSLKRKLKAVAGRTPMEFINEFRMMQAVGMLTQTTNTITEISFQVGCDEPAHFTRMFKKYYEMSPSQYRASHTSSTNC